MNLVCFLENTLQDAKKIRDEIRMKSNGSPIQTLSFMRKLAKRIPGHLAPTSKRVILGRKNQLIRMMKKRNKQQQWHQSR